MRNIWTILVKQGKYRVLPLLTFYILTTCMILVRIYSTIWLWKIKVKSSCVFLLFPSTLKFGLGLDQTWVNVEMSITLQHSQSAIRQSVQQRTSRGAGELAQFPHRLIRLGRIIASAIIFIFITCVLCVLVMIDLTKDKEERKIYVSDGFDYYVPSL